MYTCVAASWLHARLDKRTVMRPLRKVTTLYGIKCSAFRVNSDACAVFSILQEGGNWTSGSAASWVPPAVTLQL